MAAGTKKRKKRIKRQLQKRFKQTSGTVLTVETKEPRQFMAHILYKGKYKVENQAYQAQLDAVYGGKVQPIERFINPNATLVHHCSDCKKDFYAKPRWLVKGQPHECKSTGIIKNSYKKKAKKVHENTNEKKGAELAKELDELIQQGLNPRQIRMKTGVDTQIISYYKETFHTKTKQQG